MQQLLAADAAVGTGRADFLCFPRPAQPLGFLFRERADRADIHALPAENTFAFVVRAVASGDDLAFRAAVALGNGPVDHHFVAGLNAAPAQNTAAEIADDERILIFRRINILLVLFPKLQLRDFIEVRQVLKFALTVGFAHQAIVPAAGQQKFNVHFSGAMNEFAVRGYFHARRHRRRAGCH